jgi:hypothetical protein
MNGNPDRSTIDALDDLRELSREPDWNAMEARLLAGLDDRSIVQPGPSAGSRHWWQWTAAAAIVLAAAITFYLPPSRFGAALPKGDALLPSSAQIKPAPASEPARVTPPVSPASPKPRRTNPAAAPPSADSLRPPAASPYTDFVALPAAYALPELESGRIVRMEVPLTMLPVYGLDLVPEAATAAVEADFLIGQDGLPRAIRLASTSSRVERP